MLQTVKQRAEAWRDDNYGNIKEIADSVFMWN